MFVGSINSNSHLVIFIRHHFLAIWKLESVLTSMVAKSNGLLVEIREW